VHFYDLGRLVTPLRVVAGHLRCYLISVPLLLKYLMILALVVAQGPAFAAAVCQHRDAVQHVAARQSSDRHIAAAALSEEKAAAETSRKAQPSPSTNGFLTDMLSPAPLTFPHPSGEPIAHLRVDGPELAGRALSPPLQPPTA
jgi:hypothetical protein